jgi:flagellar protein FlaG
MTLPNLTSNISTPTVQNGRTIQSDSLRIYKEVQYDKDISKKDFQNKQVDDSKESQKLGAVQDEKRLKDVEHVLDEVVKAYNPNMGVKIHLDKDTNQAVYQVVDHETNKIVKQIPPEEVLKFAQKLEEMIGTLLDDKA